MNDSDAEQLYSELRKYIFYHRLNDAKLLMKRLSREERAAVANTKQRLQIATVTCHSLRA